MVSSPSRVCIPAVIERIPAAMVADYITAGHLPATGMNCIRDGALSAIAAPLDFLGDNYYTRTLLGGDAHSATPPAQFKDMDWEVYPRGLYALLNQLHFDYHAPKLYITESGCAYHDTPDAGGRIRDALRHMCHLYNAGLPPQCLVEL